MKETRKEKQDIFDLDALLHPASAFAHPMEVVHDPDLTLNEKRAILASWASDACALEAAPDLRVNTLAMSFTGTTSWMLFAHLIRKRRTTENRFPTTKECWRERTRAGLEREISVGAIGTTKVLH